MHGLKYHGFQQRSDGRKCVKDQCRWPWQCRSWLESFVLRRPGLCRLHVQQDTVPLTTGNYNVVIGTDCRTSAVDSDNQIVLGYDVAGNGDDTVTFGNASTFLTCAFNSTSWANTSDERIKKNIQDQTAGLSFIEALRPVTFEYRRNEEIPSVSQPCGCHSHLSYSNSGAFGRT